DAAAQPLVVDRHRRAAARRDHSVERNRGPWPTRPMRRRRRHGLRYLVGCRLARHVARVAGDRPRTPDLAGASMATQSAAVRSGRLELQLAMAWFAVAASSAEPVSSAWEPAG